MLEGSLQCELQVEGVRRKSYRKDESKLSLNACMGKREGGKHRILSWRVIKGTWANSWSPGIDQEKLKFFSLQRGTRQV